MSAKHLVECFNIKYVLYNIGFPGCMCFHMFIQWKKKNESVLAYVQSLCIYEKDIKAVCW